LKLAWSRSFGSTDIHPVAIQDGRVFVTEGRLFDSATPLYVLNASDGSDLWNHDFGDVGTIGHPSVFNGSVYLANGRPTAGPPLLWSLDAATGLVKWSAYLMAQGEQYWAPIRVNNIIYTNGGSFGGLYGIIATDGSQKFFTSLDQEDSWSAGYFAGNIFTFVGGHFRKHDATSGAILSAVDLPTPDHKPNTAPVFGSSLAYVIAYPNLVAIDPADDSVAWTANGTFFGTPAVADGVVYAIDTGNLVARDAITGELLWSFVGDGTLHFPPVIANGYVYVASPANVYAVSIATHRSVWSDKGGGWLAIAAHRLFIAGMGSKLTVYVLGHSVPCGTLDCITPPGSTRAPCCLDPFEAKCGVVSEVTRACTGAP
jgi:hypothetical protein